MKLLRNMVKCNICGDIIESTHRHDFKRCKCGRIFSDGGHDYVRVGFKEEGDYTDLSVYEGDKDE